MVTDLQNWVVIDTCLARMYCIRVNVSFPLRGGKSLARSGYNELIAKTEQAAQHHWSLACRIQAMFGSM